MNILKTLPKSVYVAISGGVDSSVLLHFLRKKYNVTAVHYVHNSPYAEAEANFVSDVCNVMSIPLIVGRQTEEMKSGDSQEAFWRKGRYDFFKSIDGTVCTGHTLDDAAEWYLFSSLRGQGHFMEYSHENICRPFLCIRKEDILAYANENNIFWLEDPSNGDVEFAKRNMIRHELMPVALKVNPGLHNVVRKNILRKVRNNENVPN